MNSHFFTFLVLICLQISWGQIAQAQEPHTRFYIANGGVFGDDGENANIGIWDIQADDYFVIDTIQVQSVQDLVIDHFGIMGYLAAEDSLVKYDFRTLERVATVPYKSADFNTSPYKMLLYDNLLLVAQWFDYTGDNTSYLTAYNTEDLSIVYEMPQISTTPNGMAIANGLLYVSQNNKGSIDACPPYGCYSDTLGRIEVVDVTTGTWQRTIMGEEGRDMGNLVIVDETLYAFNAGSNTLLEMDLEKEIISYRNLSDNNITLDATYYGSRMASIGKNIFFSSFEGIGQFNTTDQTVGLLIEETMAGKTIAVDGEVDPMLCVLDFDYVNTAQATVYNYNTATQIATKNIGFTPEAVAAYTYYNLTNTPEILDAKEGFSIFSSTNGNDFFQITAINPKTIVNLQIFSVLGQQIYNADFTHSTLLNTSNWVNGAYILYFQQEDKTYVQKILIN